MSNTATPSVTRPSTHRAPAAPRHLPTLAVAQRARLYEDFGSMRHGYTDTDCDRILTRWTRALGVDLCCVWDYQAGYGFGGNSCFFVLRVDKAGRRRFSAIPEGLWDYLNGEHPETGERVHQRPDAATLDAWITAIEVAARQPGARERVGRLLIEDGVNLAYRARGT